jgi:hypothetical protein
MSRYSEHIDEHILAVAAYILYKVRERRAREDSVGTPQYVQEPHVLVAPQHATLGIPAGQQMPATNVFGAPRAAPQPAQNVMVSQPPAVQQAQNDPQNSLF